MVSKEDIQEQVRSILAKGGHCLESIASDPTVLESSCDFVYKALPLPFRLVGRERVRGAILQLAERVPRRPETAVGVETLNDDMVRLNGLQQQVKDSLGDDLASKHSLRGYDAQRDIACQRLIKEIEAAQHMGSVQPGALLRLELLKAQVYGCWQRLHGSGTSQKTAVECYQRALQFAGEDPQTEAEVRWIFGRFCLLIPEGIGGGREQAIMNFERVLTLVGPDTKLGHDCAVELERNRRKRWFG